MEQRLKYIVNEKTKTGFRVQNLKYQITRLEGLRELREFKEQYKESHETITKLESRI